jgi:hypothetical protein
MDKLIIILSLVLIVVFIGFLIWLIDAVIDAVVGLGSALGRDVSVSDSCLAHGYPRHELTLEGVAYCLRTFEGTEEVQLLSELE